MNTQSKESRMLKRLLYGLLVIAVCVGCFSGCKASSPPIIEIVATMPCQIDSGGTTSFSVTGNIPARSEVHWEASTGAFANPDALASSYTAPYVDQDTNVTIAVNVIDGNHIYARSLVCMIVAPPGDDVQGEPEKPTGKKIGLSFSDFFTERWVNEEAIMRGLLEDMGYEVLSQEASYDVNIQIDQIDVMVAQGVAALVVVATDSDAIVPAIDAAAEAGIYVIAYDNLIKTDSIAAHVSFNNVEVGRQQALGVMDALDIENWDVDAHGPARIVKLGGSPSDNNAILFRLGQDEILDPLEDAGMIEIVADEWVDNWDAANAIVLMKNTLDATNNDIDGVVASNDDTALGALQAMAAQGQAGSVPISGQDATAAGCNSIVKGELTVSILKDIRNLAPLAVDLVHQLITGEGDLELESYTLTELTLDDSLEGSVDCYFLPVVQVNKDNVYELVVESGYQSHEDVYRP
jgi:D-xylose transport system substrate-binding protein